MIFGLGRLAIINSERRDAEKKRGDTLQQGIDALRQRSSEDQTLLELFRKFIIAQNAEERKALLEQLRSFKFTPPTATTTTTTIKTKAPKSTTATTTTPNSSPTTAPRPPPSTTTTTAPPSPPPSRPCVTTPVINVCPPASSSERKRT